MGKLPKDPRHQRFAKIFLHAKVNFAGEPLALQRAVVKQGRHLALTAEGEKLMSYARRLLALNDETLRALQGERLTGEIHLGMQEDFGESLMPGILGLA
jgi:hypothetical protein